MRGYREEESNLRKMCGPGSYFGGENEKEFWKLVWGLEYRLVVKLWNRLCRMRKKNCELNTRAIRAERALEIATASRDFWKESWYKLATEAAPVLPATQGVQISMPFLSDSE